MPRYCDVLNIDVGFDPKVLLLLSILEVSPGRIVKNRFKRLYLSILLQPDNIIY